MVRPSAGRARHLIDREQAARAAAIFHNDIGLQPRRELMRHDARQRIDRAAGRERHDDLDRLGGVRRKGE